MEDNSRHEDILARVRASLIGPCGLRPGDRVLAAVSGGMDSMVMLDLLARLAPEQGFSLDSASLDHGLRGDQGRRECELVRSRCDSLGLDFRAGQVDSAEFARNQRLNIQVAARELRYGFLRRTAHELGCNRLATAHHRDDQAETVLLRLFSGSGLYGLAGIRAASDGGFLIRPLLGIRRAELEAWAAANAVTWAEDPSNRSLKYRRNSLRLKVIPEIEERWDPQFRERLAALAGAAAELAERLDAAVEPLMERIVSPGRAGLPVYDCRSLGELPGLLRRHLLRTTIQAASGGRVSLSGRPLAALEALAVGDPEGGALDLPGGISASREFDRLELQNEVQAAEQTTGPGLPGVRLPEEGRVRLRLGGAWWELNASLAAPEAEGWVEPSRADCGLTEAFDFSGLDLPLSAGAWQAGDSIAPFGLGGRKKLKKIFLEKRIPRSRRRQVPVVRDRAGRVVWVCGVVRSDTAPLVENTRSALVLSARELSGTGRDEANQH